MSDLLGIYFDLAPEVYHPAPALGSNDLKVARRSLAHLRASKEEPREETPAMAFGQAYHVAVLEPDRFEKTYCVAPEGIDRRTSAGKAAWAEFLAESHGKRTLKREDFDTLRRMSDVLHRHPAAHYLTACAPGRSEVSGFWIDPDTRLACKMRLDRWLDQDGFVADLKTAEDASPEAFSRAIYNYGYHHQAAHYIAGMAVLGMAFRGWVNIAQEKEPPYAVATYSLDSAAIELAANIRRRTLEKIAEAHRTGVWPAYGDDVAPLTIPAWAFRAHANDLPQATA